MAWRGRGATFGCGLNRVAHDLEGIKLQILDLTKCKHLLTLSCCVDKALRALADATRRRILMLVWRDERSAGDIARDFSISRPAVSQHLRVLRVSKLVTLRRAGTRCLYRTNHAAIAKLRAELGAFWDDRLRALKGRLEAAERSRRRP